MNKFYRRRGRIRKKRSSIALLDCTFAMFAAGIGVYSNHHIGMQIYQESSNHLPGACVQISKTFTLLVQRTGSC